jgi:hypothetical protein
MCVRQRRRFSLCSPGDDIDRFRHLAFHTSGKFVAVPCGAAVKCIDATNGAELFAFRKAHTEVSEDFSFWRQNSVC